MAEKKLGVEVDPIAGTKMTYVQDGKTLKIRRQVEMSSLLRFAHNKRMAEGKGNFYKTVLKEDGYKSIGVTHTTIFRDYPELLKDPEAIKEILERDLPKLKTTKAKLGRNKKFH